MEGLIESTTNMERIQLLNVNLHRAKYTPCRSHWDLCKHRMKASSHQTHISSLTKQARWYDLQLKPSHSQVFLRVLRVCFFSCLRTAKPIFNMGRGDCHRSASSTIFHKDFRNSSLRIPLFCQMWLADSNQWLEKLWWHATEGRNKNKSWEQSLEDSELST